MFENRLNIAIAESRCVESDELAERLQATTKRKDRHCSACLQTVRSAYNVATTQTCLPIGPIRKRFPELLEVQYNCINEYMLSYECFFSNIRYSGTIDNFVL